MENGLPNAGSAVIDPRKLRDYALNFEHATGRYKAAFFAQMGYASDRWQVLENDIREQHLILPAKTGLASPFGLKYSITGPLTGPAGVTRQVTTVWIVRPGKDRPELVTIEPAATRKVSGNE